MKENEYKTLTSIYFRSATSSRDKGPSGEGRAWWTREEDWQRAYLCLLPRHACLCVTCTYTIYYISEYLRVRSRTTFRTTLICYSSTTRWSKGRKIRTPQAYIFNLLVLVSLTLVALHWEMTDWRIVSDVPENYYFSEILWSIRNRMDDKITGDELGAFFYRFELHVSVRGRARCLLWNIFRLAARFIETATISRVLPCTLFIPVVVDFPRVTREGEFRVGRGSEAKKSRVIRLRYRLTDE